MILLDSGAQVPAFHESLCKDAEITNDNLKVSCMTKNIIVGNYKVAKIPVSTPIYNGFLEGICVPQLQYDCILPLETENNNGVKCLLLNLSDATVHVVKSSPSSENSNSPEITPPSKVATTTP